MEHPAISNPDSLSSSETGPGQSWNMKLKKHSSDFRLMSGSHWMIVDIYFTNKCRAETLKLRLDLTIPKPRLESGTFKCISWLNYSFFERDYRGFF
jgi:hypothetical protein